MFPFYRNYSCWFSAIKHFSRIFDQDDIFDWIAIEYIASTLELTAYARDEGLVSAISNRNDTSIFHVIKEWKCSFSRMSRMIGRNFAPAIRFSWSNE